jgi:hypothetical protein
MAHRLRGDDKDLSLPLWVVLSSNGYLGRYISSWNETGVVRWSLELKNRANSKVWCSANFWLGTASCKMMHDQAPSDL